MIVCARRFAQKPAVKPIPTKDREKLVSNNYLSTPYNTSPVLLRQTYIVANGHHAV